MKLIILIAAILFHNLTIQAQNPKEILQHSFAKCQSIENGYYDMKHFKKYMSGNDTTSSSFQCYFKKSPEDTIYHAAFHYKRFDGEKYLGDVLYTGNEFVRYSTIDSLGRVMSNALRAEEINNFKHNYDFYSPLFHRNSSPFPDSAEYLDEGVLFQYLGEEIINGNNCYHVSINYPPDIDTTWNIETLRSEIHFWINKEDMIPIQYTVAFDLNIQNDTMYQFDKLFLSNYEINSVKDEALWSANSIPSYITLEDYVPFDSPDLLASGTPAPEWKLIDLHDNSTVHLSDLKGNLVLLDFFYKSCLPCMSALPGLQRLHEKFESQGLRVVGIDPYDKADSDLAKFLSKRGVTYTILLDDKKTAKDYHISGYPTIYIIDKSGDIIHSKSGYSEAMESELTEIILKNL